jgi:hypothetical protein
VVESTPIWLPWREAVNLVALRLKYTEEYAQVWIICEAAGGRIKTRGENGAIPSVAWRGVIVFDRLARRKKLLSAVSVIDSRPIKRRGKLLLAASVGASVGTIDRYNGTLRLPGEPGEIISNVEFCIEGLVTPARLPPQDNVAGREGLWANQLYAWMIGDETTLPLGPKLLPAQLELSRQIRARSMTPWDMSKPDEPKRVPLEQFRVSRFWGTTIVSVDGRLISWPSGKGEGDRSCRIMFYADEGERVFPRLDWLREEAKRCAAVARAWLTKLNDLIALDEANGPDWKRFIELVAMIGGNLENLTAEEAAAVRLLNGFSDVRANAELRPALDEAKKIRRRIGDRLTESVHADQLEVEGRSVPDLEEMRRIPGSLVTADQIWSVLRFSKLEIEGRRYVDVQIRPPEAPETNTEDAGGLVLRKNRGGSPGKWAWDRLPPILEKGKQQGQVFESIELFEEFCQNNVPLKNPKAKREEDPDPRSVRAAIIKFHLTDHATIQLPDADAQ